MALLCDAGIEISRPTICGWAMTIGGMVMPVAKAMQRQLFAGSYIQTDETPVDVRRMTAAAPTLARGRRCRIKKCEISSLIN
jgi:hypothetical protein